MKARTEQLLYLLLWSSEKLLRPTFRNLDESFEGWAYRSGFLREIALLEKKRFLERQPGNARIYRLTAKGRLRALGGRDPQTLWARGWDGRWRLVCFDVPIKENNQRLRLRRYLRSRGFGYLQNSVWVTPDPLNEEVRLLAATKAHVESLILFEGTACGGESDADIVAGAWDFGAINQLYDRHLKILEAQPSCNSSKKITAHALRSWAEAERLAWRNAIAMDPLLPQRLLPKEYLGKRAWRHRIEVLARARRNIGRLVL